MRLPTKNVVEQMSERARSKSTRAMSALVLSYADGFVTARSMDGAILEARCDVPVQAGGLVLIGVEPHAPNQLRVLDARYSGDVSGGVRSHRHRHTHTLGGSDPVPVWFGQVMDWNIEPDGLTLKLWRGAAETSAGYQLPGETTIDLSSHVPTSGARYVLLYLTNTGTISVLAGTVKTAISSLTAADIPARPANSAPLWAVMLYARQSKIVITTYRTDVIDLRLASALSAVSSGGAAWGSITGTLSNQTDLQTALDGKQPLDADLTAIAGLSPANDDILQRKAGAWTNRTMAQLAADLTTLAPLNSPAFTGDPTAPTPSTSDNDTSIATTAFVQAVKNNTRIVLAFASYNSLGSPISGTAYPYAVTLPSFTIYPKQWNQGCYIGAVNDASNYWTIELLATVSGADTTIASVTTIGMSTNVAGIKTITTFSLASLTQTNIRLAIKVTKTGNPSNISLHGPTLEYTLS